MCLQALNLLLVIFAISETFPVSGSDISNAEYALVFQLRCRMIA